MQELRPCLWNDSTCGNKLCKMYLTRSALSRPWVFLLVTSLFVTILKARPHGSFSTSLIKSFEHWSRLFFMPCLRAGFAFFHASRSRGSPFERVNLRRVVRHFRRRTDNWSFHQYIESPVRPCQQRGMEWSHAATTFCLAARIVSSNDPTDLAQPSSSMSWFLQDIREDCCYWVFLYSRRDSSTWRPSPHLLSDSVPGCWSQCTGGHSRTHQSPILEARRGVAIMRSIINPSAPPLNKKSLLQFNTIRSFLVWPAPKT